MVSAKKRKPSARQIEDAIRGATRDLETMKTFEEWCRDATPGQRAFADALPGGARGLYDEHVARLQEIRSAARAALPGAAE